MYINIIYIHKANIGQSSGLPDKIFMLQKLI